MRGSNAELVSSRQRPLRELGAACAGAPGQVEVRMLFGHLFRGAHAFHQFQCLYKQWVLQKTKLGGRPQDITDTHQVNDLDRTPQRKCKT